MTVYDLTHPIASDMPVYPGTPQPSIEKPYTIASHGFAETRLNLLSHTGTHMDAPAHMIDGAKTIDRFSADRFVGEAWCIAIEEKSPITTARLEPHAPMFENCKFLLLATGWDRYWGTSHYFSNFPVLTEEAAQWLTRFGLSGIGTDCISFDSHDSTTYPVHNILLGADMLLIENLKGITALIKQQVTLVAAPLHFTDADGAPSRVLAMTP